MAEPDLADAYQIDFIVEDLARFTTGQIIALALNVNANLRAEPPLGTPIDTGWASANWVPSIGKPFDDGGLVVADPQPALVAARAADAADGIRTTLSWTPGAGPLFSTNNVPYIGALNKGHSKQSPRNFVLTAIEKALKETDATAPADSGDSKPGKRPSARKPRRGA